MKNKIRFITVYQHSPSNDIINVYQFGFRRGDEKTSRRYEGVTDSSVTRFRHLLDYRTKGHQITLTENYIQIQAYPINKGD